CTRRSGQFDGTIGFYCWSRDGGHILFSGQQRTARNVYQLDLSTGKATRLTDKPGVLAASSFTADRTRAAAVYSTPGLPPEVWVSDLGGGEKKLTSFNSRTSEFNLALAEIIRWKSKDALEIEGILYLPADRKPGTRIPLIV